MSYPTECPKCKISLVGDLVWEHFFRIEKDEAKADELAEAYGANREQGHFSNAIAIYDRGKDRTVAWMCPACEHRWNRE